MRPLVLALPGNKSMAEALSTRLDAEQGQLELRQFPDGETYIRIEADVKGRAIILVCTLDRPDAKFLPLTFVAATARDLGAGSVGLVCPYLAYMRQDTRFKPGEGITSRYFASALGQAFDWLTTVDPHLHRLQGLSEIYAIESSVVHAAPLMAAWIRDHVASPLIVGPDSESEQWVASVARDSGAPYLVLEKRRRGDRLVEVSVPDVDRWQDRTPVLVDDIVSTARTMIEAAGRFRAIGKSEIVAVGVHGIFADNACDELRASGVSQVITSNTIPHSTNAMDVSSALAEAVRELQKKKERV